ncbi:MAG TPA: TIGR02281 family clan AA aspartic protease [Pelomicrobium sp.]|nr:TIGR02281 family clan AA aspartic protease [Pelomicrobium sp.]
MTTARSFVRRLGGAALFLALAFAPAAGATTVQVIGLGPGKVELIVNGTDVRSLRAGQASPEGVRVLSIAGDRAVLEIDGQQQTLALGQSNVVAVALAADRQGHFFATAFVNGLPVKALVDTGASVVALGVRDADQLGLAYRNGRQVPLRTAGGDVVGWSVNLPSVRVGGLVVSNVDAVVTPDQALGFILLGSSFLNRVEMQRRGETLYLLPRN